MNPDPTRALDCGSTIPSPGVAGTIDEVREELEEAGDMICMLLPYIFGVGGRSSVMLHCGKAQL